MSNIKLLTYIVCSIITFTPFAFSVPLGNTSTQKTVINSERLFIEQLPTHTLFRFEEAVTLTSETFTGSCDFLEVILGGTASGLQDATKGDIERITATGNVTICQAQRTITAGNAEIFPLEEKMVFTENPRIQDVQGLLEGARITLFRDQSKVLVEGTTSSENRPTVVLPNGPFLK